MNSNDGQNAGSESLGSDDTLAPGTRLADKYIISNVIGHGGMSIVYDATDESSQKRVAIKMMYNTLTNHQELVDRFLQEAKATSHLSHQNLGTVYDSGLTAQGQPFLVMDYLEGVNLQQFLDSYSPSPKMLIQIFMQVCDALDEAHRKGIVHRDLKPSNIMLIKDGHIGALVKLVDFGIAKLISSALSPEEHTTTHGTTFGTPVFMSPEQCAGKEMDARSDIYSLGCVMYQSFTGSQVFSGDSVYEVFYRHICEVPSRAPFQRLREPLPPEVETVIFGCLEKEPIKRPQSAGDVKMQLEAALSLYLDCR